MKTRRAHNLLEVIIATFIFTTVVVLMISVWAIYHQALTQNKSRMLAMAVARSELESHIALGYTNLVPLFGTTVTTPYAFDSWIRGRSVTLPIRAEFRAVDSAPRLAHLIVTVYWKETTGDKNLTYDAYIFDSR